MLECTLADALSYSKEILPRLASDALILGAEPSYEVEGGWDIYFSTQDTLQLFTVWRNEAGQVYGEW